MDVYSAVIFLTAVSSQSRYLETGLVDKCIGSGFWHRRNLISIATLGSINPPSNVYQTLQRRKIMSHEMSGSEKLKAECQTMASLTPE
ncbi:MAG: hypothetical protein EBU46_01710 [Nitrosomonadaceae bacterium]|nr:hypothetical protein [Nitrosomonadaceae bacterium]